MIILGISAFYHDSSAAILKNGEVIAAAQEERFTRKKNDASFPSNAVRFCLQYAGYELNEVDAIVFYDKPLLKFERLLETYYSFAPKGLTSFLASMPVWMKEKIFLKKVLHDELKKLADYDRKKVKLLFPEHHLSHAASAFYPSPFTESAIVTLDGVGEWATISISKGEGNKITVLKELDFPHSLGLLYSSFTYYCGFKVNSGEYKLMGLAPYGNKESAECLRMIELIKNKLVRIHEDGSIYLDQRYFTYATGLRMVNDRQWENLFGFRRREAEAPVENHHCNLALAIQLVTEEIVINIALEAKRLTSSENLCLAGGVALNCVANGKLHEEKIFSKIFIQPAAGDAGGALGAAYAAHFIYFNNVRNSTIKTCDALKGSYLGPEFTDMDVITVAKKHKSIFKHFDSAAELVSATAGLLADGKVVGWFQGRMEFGPRALGARSILADARRPDMQKKLNLKIKKREGFRPFAPSVLEEDVAEHFDLNEPSPYMLLVKEVKKERQARLPENYAEWSLSDKLYFERSDMPAITHIDFTARIQTVNKHTNPLFWQLLSAFKKLTGYSVLVNTSFNVRGEPIVNTPEDALYCFMETEMDYLVIGNILFDKEQQPPWVKKKKQTFTAD